MRKRGNNGDSKSAKNRQNDDKGKSVDKDKKDVTDLNDDEAANQGFGEWLRSTDGVEMMRLFVIANSLLMIVTMAWPNMKEMYRIIRDYYMEEEDDY